MVETYNLRSNPSGFGGRGMSTVDTLVAIPLIPLFPVLVTWWLPWERWLWNKVPKWILGPYLLYASFAGWHFGMPWWVCLIAGSLGFILIIAWAWEDQNDTKHDKTKP